MFKTRLVVVALQLLGIQYVQRATAGTAGTAVAWDSGTAGTAGHSKPQQATAATEATAGHSSGWKLLFRQTAPMYKPVNDWTSVNPTDPGNDNYSILDQLKDTMRGSDGKFEFKIVWPKRTGRNFNQWKQTSNPVTASGSHSGVTGYEAVDVTYTDHWGGLEKGGKDSLLDGSANSTWWYYAIGSSSAWHDGIPGQSKDPPGEQQTELYVCVGTACRTTPCVASSSVSFQLLFRQTAPMYKPVNDWTSVNPNDPGNDNYSILDQLDDTMRGGDGKFMFKIVWPKRTGKNYNQWKQTSNPVTASGSHSGVTGYEAVDVTYTDNWGGLEKGGKDSLLDGAANSEWWYYAIGSSSAWQGGIPVHKDLPGEQQTELYVGSAVAPCVPSRGELKLLFRQTVPMYKPVNDWMSVNPNDPGNDNYSILDQLDDTMRGGDGKFEFKIVWPKRTGKNFNQWKQTSNPVTASGSHSGVTGYEAVDVTYTDRNWGGLEKGCKDQSLLDGSAKSAWWYYAIGTSSEWHGGIPGHTDQEGEQQTELYVLVPTAGSTTPTTTTTRGIPGSTLAPAETSEDPNQVNYLKVTMSSSMLITQDFPEGTTGAKLKEDTGYITSLRMGIASGLGMYSAVQLVQIVDISLRVGHARQLAEMKSQKIKVDYEVKVSVAKATELQNMLADSSQRLAFVSKFVKTYSRSEQSRGQPAPQGLTVLQSIRFQTTKEVSTSPSPTQAPSPAPDDHDDASKPAEVSLANVQSLISGSLCMALLLLGLD